MPEKSVMMAMEGFGSSPLGSPACETGSSSVGAASGPPTEPWLLAISMGSLRPGAPGRGGRGSASCSGGSGWTGSVR
eukprot:9197285-Alexandrium_andersonii.AAC.1